MAHNIKNGKTWSFLKGEEFNKINNKIYFMKQMFLVG